VPTSVSSLAAAARLAARPVRHLLRPPFVLGGQVTVRLDPALASSSLLFTPGSGRAIVSVD
jgi:hypothetical protein